MLQSSSLVAGPAAPAGGTPARPSSGPGVAEAWLRRIPIRRRIFLLLGLNLAIACVLLGLAWRYEAADRLQRRLEAQYALEFDLQRIERDSERLKGFIREYFVRPEQATQAEVRRLGEDLGRRIEKSALPHPGIRGRLHAAGTSLQQLIAGFDVLVELNPQTVSTYEAHVLKTGRETSELFASIRGTLRAEPADPLAPSLGKAHESFDDAILNLNAFYLRHDAASRAEAKRSLGRITEAVPGMLDLATTDLQREALHAIAERARILEEGLERLAEMFARQRRVLDEDVDLGARRLTASIESILGESGERRAVLRAAQEDERGFALTVVVLLASVVVAAGVAMSWIIARSIRRPLGALMNTVAAFAAGELAGDVAEPSAPDEVGDLARMLQVFRDNVLARSAAEEALRRSEEQYRSVVDNAAEGIVIVQEQRIAFANPRVLAITGYAADAVVGHWFLEYVHPDDRERAMRGVPHDEDNATGDGRTQHVRLLARSGRWIVLEVKSVAIAWRGATATLNLFTDVTDRVRLEGELRRTLNEREKILENSIVGIVFLNAQGHLHWCNRATEQLYGIDRETWTGRSLEPLYPSRVEYERVGRAVSDAVRSGRSFETEIQMRRADGTPFWVLLAGKAIDSADFSAGTIWIVRDVSRRKQLEAELQRTSSEREAILNSTLVGITLSVDRVHRWVNQRFAEMLGYAPAELIGRSSRVHFPDEESYQALGRTAYPQIAAFGSYTTECQMRRKDGELIWVELYGQAIDRADPGRGTIWTFVDVTTRRRLAEQLRATSSEREAILNNTLVGITFSVDRRRLWINRRFAEMTGFEPAELIGQSSRLHFPDEASYEAFGREAYAELAKSGTYSTELQVLRKDGAPIWLELHGSTSSPGELGKGVIWTAVEVTKRREAEESMRLALQQQTELSDLKSRFVSMASHEFRTPLATILSSAELLRDYGERFAGEERAELLQSIQSSVRRMTDLLDQVLVIGRAEAGRLAYAPAPLDLEACCRRLVREAEHLGGRADVTPSRVLFGFTGEDRVVELDEKLLDHILGNLLSNALKYTPGDDPVSLEVRSTPGESTFVVSDTGIGIPEKEMPHLFETFHRASNVGNIQGTGLGLAIVKRAVDLHGGTIGVMSAAGKGSRFEVRLPHRKGASANGQDSHHRG